MRKQSMMGSSKYEFNPEQLDKDVQMNIERYEQKKTFIESELNKLLCHDSIRYDETWSIIIEVLREIKLKD